MQESADRLMDADRRYLFHPGTHADDHMSGALTGKMFTAAQGIYLTDASGRQYLDAFAGLWCVNIGYGREEMATAIYEQCKTLSFFHTYQGNTNPPVAALSQKLIEEWAPPGMAKVYFGMSGSDANETQVKLAWYYNNVLGRPQKKKLIARQRSYHGSGILSASLTGMSGYHAQFDAPLNGVLHTVCADFYRRPDPAMDEAAFTQYCVDALEKLILDEGPETIAAFFAEPVVASGGIVPPPAGYWPAIQALLKKYDVLLIVDEVVCGFGRLGARTGSEYYGIQPDLMTIAKGVTSAYVPLSGVVVSEGVWDVIRTASRQYGAMGHGWTYSGHPLGAVAALKNLEIMQRERLVENAASVGSYLQMRLRQVFENYPIVGDIRGVGLMIAIEFVQDKATRKPFPDATRINSRIVAAALDLGLIIRAFQNNIVGFSPPLVLTVADADRIVDLATQAVDAVMKTL